VFLISLSDLSINGILMGDATAQQLDEGSLFSGSFHSFGGYWFSITVWCTIGCGLTYLACGISAAVISKQFRMAAFVPLFSIVYGAMVGFGIGALSAVAIAAMYHTGPYLMQWEISMVWGLGLSAFHIAASFARGLLR